MLIPATAYVGYGVLYAILDEVGAGLSRPGGEGARPVLEW